MDQNKKYIIVAEDDKFYANIYKLKLNKEGYEVAVVGDGAQAIELVNKRVPDLLLLDLIMPVKDGFETLKELRASEKFKLLKILILSSLGQEEDARKAKELGANDYFIKTNVTIEEVMTLIKKNIG